MKKMEGIKRGRLTTEDKAEIERLAAKLKNPTPGTIALKVNRHPATVNWYMLTHGLIERPAGRAPAPYERNGKTIYPYAEEHDAFIIDLRRQETSFSKIAVAVSQKFGIDRTSHSVQVRMVQLAADPNVEAA